MQVYDLIVGIVACAVACALSAGLTWAAIAYARRRGMLDEPGRRRSHHVATPRGGGVGLVVASLLVAAVVLVWRPGGVAALSVAALCLAGFWIALTGWVDDHRALGVVPRLSMQLLASALFVAAVIATWHLAWAWLPLGVLLAMWSINLHNFMDGIDAILGLQVTFVGAGLGVLAWALALPALAVAAFAMAAAVCGFLVFNWPPARIFMGDVGSGFAGFLIFALIVLICVRVRLALWPCLILCSAFVVDAGLTLAWRMWSGKRWYTAHREHLYQWLVRCGWSHARTGCCYMMWNVLLATPAAVIAVVAPRAAPWLCVAAYVLAACAWWSSRAYCLKWARRNGGVHAA